MAVGKWIGQCGLPVGGTNSDQVQQIKSRGSALKENGKFNTEFRRSVMILKEAF